MYGNDTILNNNFPAANMSEFGIMYMRTYDHVLYLLFKHISWGDVKVKILVDKCGFFKNVCFQSIMYALNGIKFLNISLDTTLYIHRLAFS